MGRKRTSKIWDVPEQEFKETFYSSHTLTEMLTRFGLSATGGANFKILKQRIAEDGLDLSILIEKERAKRKRQFAKLHEVQTIPLEEILVENSTYNCTSSLKSRLLKEGLLEDKCAICGQENSWNGKPLSLQLDHKNGNHTDNRIENLHILCPNCHSQTDTYAGKANKREYFCSECGDKITKHSKSGRCLKCVAKSRRKVARPSKEVLLRLTEEFGFCEVGRRYGVTDNAIRRWLE